jgi:hypothetical protein
MKSKSDTEVYRLENKPFSMKNVFGSSLGKLLIYTSVGVGLSLLLAPIAAAGAAVEGVAVGVNTIRGTYVALRGV